MVLPHLIAGRRLDPFVLLLIRSSDDEPDRDSNQHTAEHDADDDRSNGSSCIAVHTPTVC